MKVSERFIRWRASRGYGVHSPLAFRMVKHVLRPSHDVIYYGEEKLTDAALISRNYAMKRMVNEARILLRFAAELQPSFVWVSPELPELYRRALLLAGCVVRIFDGKVFPKEIEKADMTVIYDSQLNKSELKKALRPGKSLIGFHLNSRFVSDVIDTLPGGAALDGVNSVIAVATSDEGRHSYKVSRF